MSCSQAVIVVGTAPVVQATLRDVDNALTTPTTLAVTTRAPDGTEVDYPDGDPAITLVSTGVYRFTFPAAITQAGTWRIRWEATSPAVAQEERFPVRPSGMAA